MILVDATALDESNGNHPKIVGTIGRMPNLF